MTIPQLSWDRAGTGEALLLLHGIGTTRDDFAALRPALEAEYEVSLSIFPVTVAPQPSPSGRRSGR